MSRVEAALQVKRGLYIMSTIPALVSVVNGMISENHDEIRVAIATPYFLWLVLFGTFLWFSFQEVTEDSKFIITCIYHLICVAATMAFISSLHTGDNNTLFLWAPIATQIGVLLAVGLQECASMISWRRIRGLVLSFLEGLRVLMGAEESQLPRYESGRYTPSLTYLTDVSLTRDLPQTLSSSTAISVEVDQRTAITAADDGSEDNPWRFY